VTRPQLRDRDRRALRIGAFVAVPLLVVNLAVRPYLRTLAELRERTEAQRELLARELALLARAGEYPRELGRSQGALDALAPRLFAGADEISRTGSLAYYVGERATRNRVLVQRVETRPGEPTGDGLVALRVEVQAMSDLEGILGFLHALESGTKLVRIERLSIGTAARLGSASGASGEEVLSFIATVTGYAGDAKDDAAPRAAAVGPVATGSGAS
jgi:hypothetical protein